MLAFVKSGHSPRVATTWRVGLREPALSLGPGQQSSKVPWSLASASEWASKRDFVTLRWSDFFFIVSKITYFQVHPFLKWEFKCNPSMIPHFMKLLVFLFWWGSPALEPTWRPWCLGHPPVDQGNTLWRDEVPLFQDLHLKQLEEATVTTTQTERTRRPPNRNRSWAESA